MSSIGSDPHLGLTGLDRLGQVALDDLRQQPGQGVPLGEAAPIEAPASAGLQVDAGERVLAAAAWGPGQGERLLPGDLGFEHGLAAQELSTAADSAIDAILAALD